MKQLALCFLCLLAANIVGSAKVSNFVSLNSLSHEPQTVQLSEYDFGNNEGKITARFRYIYWDLAKLARRILISQTSSLGILLATNIRHIPRPKLVNKNNHSTNKVFRLNSIVLTKGCRISNSKPTLRALLFSCICLYATTWSMMKRFRISEFLSIW